MGQTGSNLLEAAVVRKSKSHRCLARCPPVNMRRVEATVSPPSGMVLPQGCAMPGHLPHLHPSRAFPVHQAIFLYIGFAPVPAGSPSSTHNPAVSRDQSPKATFFQTRPSVTSDDPVSYRSSLQSGMGKTDAPQRSY